MNSGTNYTARFLVGPTAAGKTAVAQWIAERHGFEILSADSMLVYRGMDIGTAKPAAEERRRVRYWGVDVVSAGAPFNVALYVEEARRCFESAAARGVRIIGAGGTGLYVKALIEGLAPTPAPDEASRQRWRHLLAERGVGGLQAELRVLNPAWLEALPDPGNGRRLLRALECAEAGVEAPTRTWRAAGESPELIGLQMPREILHERIALRVREMYAQGLLEETRQLLAEGLGASPTARQAVGYAEAAACLGGLMTREAAIEKTIQRTRQLAKRQMTWFRHQLSVKWVEALPGRGVEETARQVLACWEADGPTPLGL